MKTTINFKIQTKDKLSLSQVRTGDYEIVFPNGAVRDATVTEVLLWKILSILENNH